VARHLRTFIAGISVHIFRRGHNRKDIFHHASDYESFLLFVKDAAAEHRMDLHGYALMTNHIHLIATPNDRVAIPCAMKEIGEQYARYYNRRHDRIGTLWSGRYKAKPIEDERYWLTCLRYVEQNPVRAGMVSTPGAYQWSSYSTHALGIGSEWLMPHPTYLALGHTDEERQMAYRNLCGAPLDDDDLTLVRCGRLRSNRG
jgi:putative transposase